jgi:choline dehydrogenase
VRADSEVAEVLLEGAAAVGVRLIDGTVVRAGWVVLCAGVYGSPAILMRSGIGPVDHLRDLGIPVAVELPGVGANLADHPGVDVDFGTVESGPPEQSIYSFATLHSSLADPAEAPDLGLWWFEPWGDPAEAGLTAMVLTPRSRGTVRLRSSDPRVPPRITLPGLDHPDDVARMLEAYERGWQVCHHPAVRRLCGPAPAAPVRGAEAAAHVVREAWSFPHTVGTCAMGSDPSAGAVVDASGRVHGTDRLSVVDASIIPTAPSGFPHLITIMVAEKIAEQLPSAL